MAETIEKSLQEVDFASLTRRTFTPSPAAWEDQVLYFLLLDRFSDGQERDGYRDNEGRPVQTGATPPYRPEDPGRVDYETWLRGGNAWQGGTLRGLKSKLGYLRRLGVTALWVSPIFRQVAFEPSYHGYGVQNFLDVDPHFGTREEFRDFVKAAHDQGIYIILDIIAHHTGNVFSYAADRYMTHDPASGRWYNDPRWDGKPYAVQGFNDREGRPTLPYDAPDGARLEGAWPDGAVWPREFQRPHLFLHKGHIVNWDHFPEYAEGDMFGLKTLDIWVQWNGQYRQASSALACLILVYCFWIAYADIDGFRIDAAKHMGMESLRVFCDVIREFTQGIGKERFLLVGEVGGGREHAWDVVEKTGLDAALGIDDVPGKLERMVTGYAEPAEYFSVFRNWVLDEPAGPGHRWYRNQVVTLVDDHDQVRKGFAKQRFCGDGRFRDLAFNVMAVQLTTMGIPCIYYGQLTTMGIPCIYYGSEQGFDSGGRPNGSDLVLRESMFGGKFGGLCTQGRHFFNEDGDLYRALAALIDLRQKSLPLRRGRQVFHRISGDGVNFGLPRLLGERMRSLVSWSRLFTDREVLVAINTDEAQPVTAYSTVAPTFRVEGDQFHQAFWHAPKAAEPPPSSLTVERRNGLLAVRMTLPPAGFVIYRAAPTLERLGSSPPPDLKPWQPRPAHG
jgi:glycosidase